jgi:hypothetical protein
MKTNEGSHRSQRFISLSGEDRDDDDVDYDD